MTQSECASRIGVAQSYLSALERGEKEPGAAVLLAISREFAKSVDWLLTGRDPNRRRTVFERIAKGLCRPLEVGIAVRFARLGAIACNPAEVVFTAKLFRSSESAKSRSQDLSLLPFFRSLFGLTARPSPRRR